jgi:dTDP-4-amino-4,6-dideoxygalactose transaminase
VNSGTDALSLVLRGYGIGSGDEVITAPNSFLASASSVAAIGATSVFADVCPDYNIAPAEIIKRITPRTRALIPVHLTGKPAAMDEINAIAKKHRLKVVEDAAQAIGAVYHGKRVGALGDAGCFSLHPLKTLNACGDAGIITTDDEDLYHKLMQLRNIGLKNRDETDFWGYNSRLDSMQAAILSVKIELVEGWVEKRRRNAHYYNECLAGVVGLPQEAADEKSAYHTYVIQADRRDELQAFLARNGISTKVHYPIPIHLQKAAAGLGYQRGDFPMTERLAGRILSLPIYPELTREDLDHVVTAIQEFYQR